METGVPSGSSKPETDRDAELALSLHRNLNWAGRERSSRHQQPGPGPKEQALRRVRDEVHDRKRRRDAVSPRGTDDSGKLKKHLRGDEFGGAEASTPQAASALDRPGFGSRAAVQWALPRSALTAAVREARAKATSPCAARQGWDLVKCFVTGSIWAWLLPVAALTSPAALLEALEAKTGSGSGEHLCLTLVSRRGTVARFDAASVASQPSARWTAAAEDAARVYVGPPPT